MNLLGLVTLTKTLLSEKKRGSPLQAHDTTRDRITLSRAQNVGTHARHIATTLGRSSPTEVDAAELTDENALIVKDGLLAQGKREDVIANTLSSFRFFRDLAGEMGIVIWTHPKLDRPKRSQVYRCVGGRQYVSAIRAEFVSNNEPYGLRMADWPEGLLREYDDILACFTDPLHDGFFGKRPRSKKYMNTWLNRSERAFGFLIQHGIPKEELSFKLLTRCDLVVAYRKYLHPRRGDKDTMTTKGDLEHCRQLAEFYYEDAAAAEAISKLIRKKCHFVKVKDKGRLVEANHPDDYYRVLYALVGEAEHYEANLHRKYGRKDPSSTMAHKWMEAGIWALMTVSWLREGNVAMATTRHIYKQPDGLWHYRFSEMEMKSRRAKADQVIDLWKGDEIQGLIQHVLDKVVEVRPLLLCRFQAANPGKPDPEGFFLNMDGADYSESALRCFCASASKRYLEKRLSFHDVRSIIPSWLFVREGSDVLAIIQRRLDHASIRTTEEFYLRVEMIFGTRLAKLRMDERERQKKALANLAKLPDQVAGMLNKHQGELIAKMEEMKDDINPAALNKLDQILMALELLKGPKADPAA